MQLDSVQIGVTDLAEARAAYALLLGMEPVRVDGGSWRFQLGRGAVELERGEPGVHAVRFRASGDEAPWPTEPAAFHGLRVLSTVPCDGDAPPATDASLAIDHVVVHTSEPDRAIALWHDRLGLRLALDRTFPERGLRLIFFRSGGITLEFMASHPPAADAPGPDRFFGVSYRVPDLEARRERLLHAGVDVTPIRVGMKPGTSVATVRSGTAGVPTLLLQVDSGA